MELDRVLELAVVLSWEDLVKPGEKCSVNVEYENVVGVPICSLEVWTTRNRGYGTLVCRYFAAPTGSVSASPRAPLVYFANSYRSKALADTLDFIVRNQGSFTRLPSSSIHGLVQLEHPTNEDRSDATTWSHSVHS